MLEHKIGLDKIIKKRISQGCSYMDALKSLYGADPREVWKVFREYKSEVANKIGMNNLYPGFSEPHLAYSQWRITPKSSQLILDKLFSKNYHEICFLGCPILGMKFQELTQEKSFFLDIDKTILDFINHNNKGVYDVNDEIPDELKNRFECVVIDPPWYYNEIKLFLKRSSDLAKKGGTIYLSIPGLLTRPTILEERLDFQKWLSNSNLVISELNSNVEYEVPPFEYMAYIDIPAFTGEIWRKGDWVKLKKVDENKQTVKGFSEQDKWLEFSFDEKRIFLKYRNEKEEYRKPKLSFLYPNNSLILNSVSRRNSIISKIDVWTSRNAVFHLNKGFKVVKTALENIDKENQDIILEISRKYNESSGKVSTDCSEAIRKLKELVSI